MAQPVAPAATKDVTPARTGTLPHVVIVGAGFGGLACAQALGSRKVRVTVIDRNNYHMFVPLLYQVATAALSPADIAEPVRRLVHRHRNIDVVMGTVTGIDRSAGRVLLAGGEFVPFDRLVLATGSRYDYFGHDDWQAIAPGLKSVADARRIRTSVLSGFEEAEVTQDRERQRDLTTTVIIGGGPTGVELAGAIAELTRWSLRRDFRNIDPTHARTILLEAGPRILGPFPERLARYAHARLERIGVEIRTGSAVDALLPGIVTVGGETIRARTIIWGAGVRASPVADWLDCPADKGGRVPVDADFTVKGMPGVYVIGDAAACTGEDGTPLPGLAQVAQQQGTHLGKVLATALEREERTGPGPSPSPSPSPAPTSAPFRYRNRGSAAVVGRSAAVFDFGTWHLVGAPAWVLWGLVHVYLLAGFGNRITVTLRWLWQWLTYQSGARLITDEREAERQPANPEH
jgi:NADH dehydrogenase